MSLFSNILGGFLCLVPVSVLKRGLVPVTAAINGLISTVAVMAAAVMIVVPIHIRVYLSLVNISLAKDII